MQPTASALDVLVIHDAKTYPGVVLRCKPVGILEVEQKSKGQEGKERPCVRGARPLPSRDRFAGQAYAERNAGIASMLAAGASWSSIQAATGCSRATVAKIAKRQAKQAA